jgi:hypothetical protein
VSVFTSGINNQDIEELIRDLDAHYGKKENSSY